MKGNLRVFRAIRGISLRRKILLIVSVTCLVVFLVCGAVFQTIYLHTLEQNARRNLEAAYHQKYGELDDYLAGLDNLAYTIMYSNWAQDLLNPRSSWSVLVIDQVRSNATHFLSSLSTVNNDIRFAIFTATGGTVQNNTTMVLRYDYDIEQEPWYDRMVADKKYMEYTLPDNIYHNAKEPMLMLYYPISDKYSFQLVGYLMISIPRDRLHFLETVPFEDFAVRLVDGRGAPVVADGGRLPGEIGEGFGRTGEAWDYGGAMPVEGWRLLLRYQPAAPDGQSGRPFRVLFLLMLPVGLFCLLVALWFSRYLTGPILRCKGAILAIRDNRLGIQVENGYTDEIGELIDGLNDMSSTIANLVDQNRIIYLLKRDAEFEMLQQKINPHFLYNTLEIINGLILDGENRHAIRVNEMLGQMFRYNLDDRKWVTIREECDYARRYLAVLGYSRFTGLEIEFEVEPELERQPILKFLMQPIVENSIRHGFAQRGHGCITIRIQSEGERIHIAIMDNGRGMDEQTLARLKRELVPGGAGGEDDGKAHIGLRNVYRRLHLEYGDAMRFDIVSVLGRGTRTELRLPKEGKKHV